MSGGTSLTTALVGNVVSRNLARIGVSALAAAAVALGVAQIPRGYSGRSRPHPPARASPSGIRFENLAERAGLSFAWRANPRRPLRILDTFGCGCAFLDFDLDGWLDVLLVGEPACALFRNDGRGRFANVSSLTGLDRHRGQWKGCAVGDYDGDGYPDVLLTGYRRLALLRNVRGAGLQNVTVAAGLREDNQGHWGSSAGFMDLDGDGDLDLVLLNYVVFNEKTPQLCELSPGVKSGCPPQTYEPEHGILYRNEGGRFRDVTRSAGFSKAHGKALVVSGCDYDGDGRIDFYVGNDGTPADLMHNLGGFQFENVGNESGTAFGAVAGQAIASMGADWADYDRDGRLDLAVSAFENESFCLYKNEGGNLFRNVAQETGLSRATMRPLGFGTNFLDADNDGYPDLFYANGHVYDNTDRINPGSTFRQPMMLFHNEAGRRLVDLAPAMGGEWVRPILGRGSARGDYDNDGRMDLLVVDYEGRPLLLHNESETRNHWIEVAARGLGRNRLGYGLRVTARAGSQLWIGDISPSASFLSTSAPRVHFGLGAATQLDSVALRWPSGKNQVLRHVRADQILTVAEPPS
jgi:hypothetical protein